MKERNDGFSNFEGMLLGIISVVALAIAMGISLPVDSHSSTNTNGPVAEVAAQ